MIFKHKIVKYIPLAMFLILIIICWRGLSLNPREIPSVLINQAVPEFNLPELAGQDHLTVRDLQGKVTLLNVWATWCEACQEEHPLLLNIADQYHVPIIGVDYKDDPTKARQWLNDYGNPYQRVGLDQQGKVAIDFGVYGTPETFIIDKTGTIRYKQIGIMTQSDWDKTIYPLILRLRKS